MNGIFRRLLLLFCVLIFCGCVGEVDFDEDDAESSVNHTLPGSPDTGGDSGPGQARDGAVDGDPDPDPDPDPELLPCPSGAFEGIPVEPVEGTYFVALDGDDENAGTSLQTAFRTVQRGVDALEPGDTLIIAPGEYFESVRRENLGSHDATTTIRAQIPGTAVLRGDVDAPAFRKLEGYRYVYVADFQTEDEIQVVNELDTMTVMPGKPNIGELEFTAGTFFQDREAGKVYIASSDKDSALSHRYSFSMIPTHGFHLGEPIRVVVEGIVATGFNTARVLPRAIDRVDRTSATVWSLFIANGEQSVIRNSYAILNARGIGINSGYTDTAGDNVIEHSMAWGNASQFGSGDTGGITLLNPRRDIVRDSASFLNGQYGVNIRGGGTDGQRENHKSFMIRNISWGNGHHDIRLKTGYSHVHETHHCIALGGREHPC